MTVEYTVDWIDGAVVMIDQTALPAVHRTVRLTSCNGVADAIRTMVVRGAPAIGVAAAFRLALAARDLPRDAAERDAAFDAACRLLASTRPTAVNLFWAIDRMQKAYRAAQASDGETLFHRLLEEARSILTEDVEANRSMGRHGASLIPDGATVLTHCNAGALATAAYGTALGVIRAAVESGKRVSVLADETRPRLQGAMLTAYELHRDGIPVTVISDGAAASFMRNGSVSCAIVGADRIATNGDVANKIGTYSVAIACRHHRIPFYVAAPLSTLDLSAESGDRIPIEEREPSEVIWIGDRRLTPPGVEVRNPAFDVTPAELITAVITERGVARPPYLESLAALRSLASTG